MKKDYKHVSKEKLNYDLEKCPCCKTGRMITIQTFAANAPPILIDSNNKKLIRKIN